MVEMRSAVQRRLDCWAKRDHQRTFNPLAVPRTPPVLARGLASWKLLVLMYLDTVNQYVPGLVLRTWIESIFMDSSESESYDLDKGVSCRGTEIRVLTSR